MATRTQLRNSTTGESRMLEVDTSDDTLSIYSGDGASPLTKFASHIIIPLGGQFLLDPNEINGWGTVGPVDDSNTQDLGNVGASTLNRNAGGLVFPFDVRLNSFFAWHRNNNAAALAWGWVVHFQAKAGGSNSVVTTYLLDEVADNGGAGPRDYGNNQNQLTDIDFSGVPAAQSIPAGDVIGLAVAAPTADATNRFVQIQAGYLELERI